MKLTIEENNVIMDLAERYGLDTTLRDLMTEEGTPIGEVIFKARRTCHDGLESSGLHTDYTGNIISILNYIYWIQTSDKKSEEYPKTMKDYFESHGHKVEDIANALLHGKNGAWNEVETMSTSRIVGYDELLEYLNGLYTDGEYFDEYSDDEYGPFAGIIY